MAARLHGFCSAGSRTDPGPAAAPAAGVAATFTMAQLSREFGLTPRALRFYENRGFLAPRRTGRCGLYGGSDHERLALHPQGQDARLHAARDRGAAAKRAPTTVAGLLAL